MGNKYLWPHHPHTHKKHPRIAALRTADYKRLLPNLERVAIPLAWAVYESGGKQDYMYVPITKIVSMLYATEDGSSAEIAVVGYEGLVGIA